ncbi:MAG: fasciclin domain-containing protein [Fimbriimonadaceae bacterium]|nr:fasciclin domain-containing protein [Fimbriimonadaceae bacterium]
MKIRFGKMNAMVLAGAMLAGLVTAAGPSKDIVDTAVGAKDFTTLVSLVKEAGLVDTLKSKGPFTVFAPSDKAFAKLPKATVQKLMKDKELLKQVVLYHVVAGEVTAAQVVKLSKATTAGKEDVMIKVVDGKVMVNNATVTATDIMASNGVIHVIDTVLIPPTK